MGIPKEKLEYFKKELEKNKKNLEDLLKRIAKKNPLVSGDWEVEPVDLNPMLADKNEMADVFEELENRKAIEDKLEERLTFVNEALERIKKGVYGFCLKCKQPIDEARLKANPAARHCIKHAENK
ncbi:MAG: TraR/DksA C4-type zinc finger protein [Patescibacteria group bacterium]